MCYIIIIMQEYKLHQTDNDQYDRYFFIAFAEVYKLNII